MRDIASYCGAKTKSKRIPAVDDLAGWDVGNGRSVGLVLEIEEPEGAVETAVIQLFETEHGPPSDPAEIIRKPMEEVYRVCAHPSLPLETHGRCHFHQGGPSGPRNGNFKHGRYSRHLPTRLAADYEEVMSNPEFAELDHDVALVQARIIDLLSRVERGESGSLWRELHDAASTFSSAVREGKVAEVRASVEKIYQVTERGGDEMVVWGEIMELVEMKRKLLEATARIAEKRQTIMTVERAYTLLAYVENGLRRAVEANVESAVADQIMGSFADYMRTVYHGQSVITARSK